MRETTEREREREGQSEEGRAEEWSEEKRARQNGRTCDSMRFTAALRRFIAPSKHKMPGREACMRVGTPPLHFYRRLPVKPGNIPPISCSRERSRSAISYPLFLYLSLFLLLQMRSMALCSGIFVFFFVKFRAFSNFYRKFSWLVLRNLSLCCSIVKTCLWVTFSAAIVTPMTTSLLFLSNIIFGISIQIEFKLYESKWYILNDWK